MNDLRNKLEEVVKLLEKENMYINLSTDGRLSDHDNERIHRNILLMNSIRNYLQNNK